MNPELEKKLKQLPSEPGVYFHKNATGEIIYVGKAAVLKNRVRQYFQKSRVRDVKTDALVAEIVDTDWMTVDSELEALFLEAEMVRRYMPRYNILLRDDKSLSYIRIDINSDYPTVSTTRRPLDDKARYFGPYLSLYAVREALKLLRRVFPFATKQAAGQKRANLHYYLGLDPGLESGKTSLEEYRANLRRLIAVIEGKKRAIMHELESEMKLAAAAQDFESAARLRNQIRALRELDQKVVFSDKEFLDISKDHALSELVDLLGLAAFPRRIEGYDISHMSGTNVVASMVVFTNGVSDKGQYRKFKMSFERNDDFANMRETLLRRLSEKNLKAWGKPDIILIDGGKGQLDAALSSRNEKGLDIPMIGLAKKQEQIVVQAPTENRSGSLVEINMETLQKLGGFMTTSQDFMVINLPHNTNLVKLLQRIRDESHRFAVSYHSSLKVKNQTKSLLDDLPGIGAVTRRKLLKAFGSLRGVKQASLEDLAVVVGRKKAEQISKYL